MKLNVNTLMAKALLHERRGEVDAARNLYQQILHVYPKNTRAQKGISGLNKSRLADTLKSASPPQQQLDALIGLYNQGLLVDVNVQAQALAAAYPSSFMLWNIIGATHQGLGRLEEAEVAYRKAADANPNDAYTHNNMGVALKAQGKLVEAIAAYDRALALNPGYAEAQFNIGNALNEQGSLDSAVAAYRAALAQKPDYASAYNNLSVTLQAQGKLEEATDACERALALKPWCAETCHDLGVILKAQGKLDGAIAAYHRALALKPDYAEALCNMGNALKDQGKLDAAIAAYQKAVSHQPDFPEALNNMGNALKDQGKLVEATAAYQRAIELKPDYASAFNNMGVTLQEQGRLVEAVAACERALALKPDYAEAYYNMGNVLKTWGRIDEAITAYHQALDLRPGYAEAFNNMGNALKVQRRLDEALSACKRALALKPGYAEACQNMGIILMEQGKLEEAIAACERALTLKPDCAEAYYNMGIAFQEQGRLDMAIAAYERALFLKPDYAEAHAKMLHQKQHICDFSIAGLLPEASAELGILTVNVATFAALAWADHPAQQLQRSHKHATEQYKQLPLALAKVPKTRPSALRIGYFSADFHDHATMYLMAGLLRAHDKNRFEVFAYSYGRSKSGAWRTRAENDVDHFFDVTDQSHRQIADLARSHALDIAIDLKGYTAHTRSEIFQYRLAPIQINYLGYPGSMGAEFMDYIIADPVVIPQEQRPFYSEKVIYLPHTYQPNDDTREIAHNKTFRVDVGLPEGAFVLCCFNNNYKISPREFDIWMRVLSKAKRCILWLLGSNEWAEQNLRKEAAKRGVDPARLIFAQKVSHSEHLARHTHADLFVDTFNYNAHTTASDALWGGVPVVTKQGKQFAARVAASLLTAIDLPELITETEEHYESLILELVTQPEKLVLLKAKLAKNRLTTPLFDTKRYTLNFERGLQKAYDLYFAQRQPEDIWVN